MEDRLSPRFPVHQIIQKGLLLVWGGNPSFGMRKILFSLALLLGYGAMAENIVQTISNVGLSNCYYFELRWSTTGGGAAGNINGTGFNIPSGGSVLRTNVSGSSWGDVWWKVNYFVTMADYNAGTPFQTTPYVFHSGSNNTNLFHSVSPGGAAPTVSTNSIWYRIYNPTDFAATFNRYGAGNVSLGSVTINPHAWSLSSVYVTTNATYQLSVLCINGANSWTVTDTAASGHWAAGSAGGPLTDFNFTPFAAQMSNPSFGGPTYGDTNSIVWLTNRLDSGATNPALDSTLRTGVEVLKAIEVQGIGQNSIEQAAILNKLGDNYTVLSAIDGSVLITKASLQSIDTKATAGNASLSSLDTKSSSANSLLGAIQTNTSTLLLTAQQAKSNDILFAAAMATDQSNQFVALNLTLITNRNAEGVSITNAAERIVSGGASNSATMNMAASNLNQAASGFSTALSNFTNSFSIVTDTNISDAGTHSRLDSILNTTNFGGVATNYDSENYQTNQSGASAKAGELLDAVGINSALGNSSNGLVAIKGFASEIIDGDEPDMTLTIGLNPAYSHTIDFNPVHAFPTLFTFARLLISFTVLMLYFWAVANVVGDSLKLFAGAQTGGTPDMGVQAEILGTGTGANIIGFAWGKVAAITLCIMWAAFLSWGINQIYPVIIELSTYAGMWTGLVSAGGSITSAAARGGMWLMNQALPVRLMFSTMIASALLQVTRAQAATAVVIASRYINAK